MRTKLVWMACWMVLATTAAGQSPAIDSLQKLAAKERQREKQVMLLYEVVDLQSELDTGVAYSTLRTIRRLAKGDKYLQAFDPYYEGQIVWLGDTVRTKKLYLKAIRQLQPYDSFKARQITSNAWNNYGILLQAGGRQDEFLDVLLHKSMPIKKEIGDTAGVAVTYNNMGYIYANKEDYQTALGYFEEAIAIARPGQPSLKKHKALADAYNSATKCLLYLNKDLKTIKVYLDNAHQHLTHVDDPAYHTDYYVHLGKYYGLKKDYESAIAQFDHGLAYAGKIPAMVLPRITLVYEKAFALKELGRFREGKILLDSLIARQGTDFMLNSRSLVTKLQAEIEAKMGDYASAYHSLKTWGELSDSLHAINEKTKIAEIRLKYGHAEQENQILKLENDNRRFLTLVIFTVLLLVAAGIIFLIMMRSRKKQNEQRVVLLEKEKEMDVKNALIQGEEQERRRLARDLHDGLGGTFAGIKLKLENAARKRDTHEINDSVQLLDKAIQEFRQTTHQLIPEYLKNGDLESSVKNFCLSFHASGIRFQFYFEGVRKTGDREKELVIFRIIQELVTNAVKHAHAENILLNCILENGQLLLAIEDDGVGFDPNAKKGGVGISNMESRLRMLGGNMHIESAEGKGTCINIEVPW